MTDTKTKYQKRISKYVDPVKEEANRLFLEKEMKTVVNNLSNGIYDTIRDKVAFILFRYPQARNNIRLLYSLLVKKFYPKLVSNGYLSFEAFMIIPMAGDVRRHRAFIQNQLGLFPPDPKVKSTRKAQADEARKEFTVGLDPDSYLIG